MSAGQQTLVIVVAKHMSTRLLGSPSLALRIDTSLCARTLLQRVLRTSLVAHHALRRRNRRIDSGLCRARRRRIQPLLARKVRDAQRILTRATTAQTRSPDRNSGGNRLFGAVQSLAKSRRAVPTNVAQQSKSARMFQNKLSLSRR
jgi:hypothetical protein